MSEKNCPFECWMVPHWIVSDVYFLFLMRMCCTTLKTIPVIRSIMKPGTTDLNIYLYIIKRDPIKYDKCLSEICNIIDVFHKFTHE